MLEKIYYDYLQVHDWVNTITFQMYKDGWRPDYIVGLTRGGLIPAVVMSHNLDIPMHTLEVKLRDHANTESNCWMAEDAWGYGGSFDGKPVYDEYKQKNILIIDDINDTGATLDWIIQDWQQSCFPNSDHWNSVWGNNVRFATLVDNVSSNFSRKVDYYGRELNKSERDVWIVFPWER